MTELTKDISIFHCQPLVSAVLLGLEKRFKQMFKKNHLQLASIYDPNFKKIWADEDAKAQLNTLLRSVVQRHQSTNSTPDQGYFFFCDYLFKIIVNGFILHFLRNTNIPSPTKNPAFLTDLKRKGHRLNPMKLIAT